MLPTPMRKSYVTFKQTKTFKEEKVDDIVMKVLKKVLESGHDKVGFCLYSSVIGDTGLQECIAVPQG